MESSYEFPELNLIISEELNFREHIYAFYIGYARGSVNQNLLRSMLGYMASLHDDNYGEFVARYIKRLKRTKAKISILFFWNKNARGRYDKAINTLTNFYNECEERNDIAKELREMPTERLAAVMDEQWDEVKYIWEDVNAQIIKDFMKTKGIS